jgi:hypothetical protein
MPGLWLSLSCAAVAPVSRVQEEKGENMSDYTATPTVPYKTPYGTGIIAVFSKGARFLTDQREGDGFLTINGAPYSVYLDFERGDNGRWAPAYAGITLDRVDSVRGQEYSPAAYNRVKELAAYLADYLNDSPDLCRHGEIVELKNKVWRLTGDIEEAVAESVRLANERNEALRRLAELGAEA